MSLAFSALRHREPRGRLLLPTDGITVLNHVGKPNNVGDSILVIPHPPVVREIALLVNFEHAAVGV